MNRVIILHPAELQLKRANRPFFERALMDNIRMRFPGTSVEVKKATGKFLVRHIDLGAVEVLKKIPGIANVCPAFTCEPTVEALKALVLAVAAEITKNTSFKIEATRSDKTFPLNSMQLAVDLGAVVVERYALPVDVHTPDVTIHIEVDKKEAYVYTQKFGGAGGLPTGTSGKVIALLSGGIDSPVASRMMMTRGCEVIGVHFQNFTAASTAVQDKVEQLTRVLAEHQGFMKTYSIPFGELQRRVVMTVPAEVRMLVYRRIMFLIAQHIARHEHAGGLVTGDSLGQVASQTLENIAAVRYGMELPILSPLVGVDKNYIMDQARRIGTYDISILPYDDCCSMFVAEHPETRATAHMIERALQSTNFGEDDIKQTLEQARVISF
ncbi:MAG TPA: tRNA 4-thiouridine(8) synthase ThiI [Candidatus Magasanikbacteria bacterium]|nr:tRNA 4-thiouridine(8) synthase ThiI [Candidatus Magasanikbacteria bacterium]